MALQARHALRGEDQLRQYLWHLVAMRLILTKISVPETTAPASWWEFYGVMTVGTFVRAVVLALISWYLIEQAFLQLRRFVPYE